MKRKRHVMRKLLEGGINYNANKLYQKIVSINPKCEQLANEIRKAYVRYYLNYPENEFKMDKIFIHFKDIYRMLSEFVDMYEKGKVVFYSNGIKMFNGNVTTPKNSWFAYKEMDDDKEELHIVIVE